MTLIHHSEELRPDWLDAYGHLNEAYYVVVFSNANWVLQDYLQVGTPYTRISGNALYTIESHIRYLKEVRAPATLDVSSRVFRWDTKRLHIGHVLTVGGEECATFECVLVHVNMATGKSCSFPKGLPAKLDTLSTQELPAWSGSRVSLSR